MTRRLRIGFLAACLASPALAQTVPDSATGPTSQTVALTSFAKEAAIGGMLEVELGRIAVQKASNPAVKAFGQRMIDDHSRANVDLQAAAAQTGVQLPSSIGPKQKKTLDKLSALSGAAFDRAYIDDMVKDHKEDVALFEKAARAPGDSPLKKFAAEKLSTLRDHLQMAEQVQATLAKAAAPPSGGP